MPGPALVLSPSLVLGPRSVLGPALGSRRLEAGATEAIRELLLKGRTKCLVEGHLVAPAARAAAPELNATALAGFGKGD